MLAYEVSLPFHALNVDLSSFIFMKYANLDDLVHRMVIEVCVRSSDREIKKKVGASDRHFRNVLIGS